jgi:hypothetical protein
MGSTAAVLGRRSLLQAGAGVALVRHEELGLVGSPAHLSSGGFAMHRTPPGLDADGDAVLAER